MSKRCLRRTGGAEDAQNGTSAPRLASGPAKVMTATLIHSTANMPQIHFIDGVILKTRTKRRLMQITREEKAEPRSPAWMKTACAVQSGVG